MTCGCLTPTATGVLSELGQALQVGRITADEFDQRSGTITPGALAVLLVVLLIFVRVTRAARS